MKPFLYLVGQTARPEQPQQQEQQQEQPPPRQGPRPASGTPPERGGTDTDATAANDDDL